MPDRFRAIAAVILWFAAIPAAAQRTPAAGQFPPYKPPRMADGHPDLNGVWQAFVTANWDLQDHVEEWMVEAGSPNTLLRRGLTKDSLKVGTEIVVEGYQSKDGALRANGRDVTLPNGQTLFLGSSNPDASNPDKPKQ